MLLGKPNMFRLGEDIQSKVLAFAFGLSAEIECNLISQRTKEVLARKKANGIVLGRPKGKRSAPEKHKLFKKRILIIGLLEEKISKRQMVELCKVNRNTFIKILSTHYKSKKWQEYPNILLLFL